MTSRQLTVPTRPPEIPPPGRAIELPLYLQRIIPQYGAPAWLQAMHWRQFVRNQPLAIVFRDTLINGIKNLEWDIVPVHPEDVTNPLIAHACAYYKELFEGLDGDFDSHIDLMSQDYLDLPFGGGSEVIKEDDDPQAPVLAVEHIDAASLWPTLDEEFPVMQMVPDVPQKAVAFPRHAINRILFSPRPELRRKGWGMAPPEKIYLAIEMLYRGDQYYWKLLLDTPEAGILDLLDMDKQSALDWLVSFRELLGGIDGFKVPVLYEHEKPAVWTPFTRPPLEMLYDKTMMFYAQVLAGGYGMRISDIGLEEARGGGTLAGVIRSERQTRRSGLANLREALKNYFNRLLPKLPDSGQVIKFVWVERDDEAMVARGRALLAVGQGLSTLIQGQMLDSAEGRQELINLGLMETKLDPNKLITAGPASVSPIAALLAGITGKPVEGATGAPPQTAPPPEPDKVPPSAGGRGDQSKPTGFATRVRNFLTRRTDEQPGVPFGKNPATRDAKAILAQLDDILRPGLLRLNEAGTADDQARIRRLMRVATKVMVPTVVETLRSLDDEMLQGIWLPEMNAMTFGQPSQLDSLVTRQDEGHLQDELDAALSGEDWWRVADMWDRQAILELYAEAYSMGMEDAALKVVRSLYERGLAGAIPTLSFTLTNPQVFAFLESRAGDLVTQVNDATKTFIKRVISAGVRQGIASPEIAQALRDGATADEVLEMEGFTNATLDSIMDGMVEMSEARANSIVNYEVAWAENAGRFEELNRSGFKEKAWVHLGPRGITEAGNIHPCMICEANEAMGFVPIDFVYETVFEGSPFPPAHPGVCHCGVAFNPVELEALVASGDYSPWVGD
jgi:hypothetical protein